MAYRTGRQPTHGMTGTRAHNAWVSMRKRCLNKNHPAYKNYGGRGVIICKRWMDSFENFLADMGVPPKGLSLERINNDGNYEPDNCKWATRKEQNHNRRSNVVMDGLTLSQAAEISGHSQQVINWRVHKMGMTIHEAMNTPKLRNRMAL